ncbi:zinc finger CCCH domain-containing protein 19 [Tanacetum coccineum]
MNGPHPTSQHLNSKNLHHISITIFVTNFPTTVSSKDLWKLCDRQGVVADVYIARKLSKSGRRFGFVRFIKNPDQANLLEDLNKIWIGASSVASIARGVMIPESENHRLTSRIRVSMESKWERKFDDDVEKDHIRIVIKHRTEKCGEEKQKCCKLNPSTNVYYEVNIPEVANDSSIVSPSTPPGNDLNIAKESCSTWLDYVGPLITDELDSEKRWSYRDPKGNIQGSFSLAQLHMWKDYFPSDLQIWSYYGNVKETILLHNALKRRTKNAG